MSNKSNNTYHKIFKYCSLGLGQQSTLFALWIGTEHPLFEEYWGAELIFADTKEEQDETYEFLYNSLIPFLVTKGKFITILDRPYSLLSYFYNKKEVPLGWVNPKCSSHFKRDRINEYLRKKLGRNGRIFSNEVKVIEVLGIGPEEISRLKPPRESWKERHFPLVGIGIKHNGETFNLGLDLPKMTRGKCIQEIKKYNLPVPPKSGCRCCPNKGEKHFLNLKFSDNEYFQKCLELEKNAKEKNVTFLPNVKLSSINKQKSLLDFETYSNDDHCDGGYCFT